MRYAARLRRLEKRLDWHDPRRIERERREVVELFASLTEMLKDQPPAEPGPYAAILAALFNQPDTDETGQNGTESDTST